MKYFMGVDVGTYESKGVIIDEKCSVVAQAVAKHGLENPKENYFEHDAQKVWWHDVCKITNELIQVSGIKNSDIKCLGTSALGADLLPVDQNCTPLRKAILYGIDARASKEIETITGWFGEEKIHRLYGRPLCSSDLIPKFLWIKNNEPEIYKKTYKFLTASSYITAKLTGEYVVDRYLARASFNPLYSEDGTVNEQECGPFCKPQQLARCLKSTDTAGYITKQAAEQTGLCEGMPVLTGTDDAGAEAISTGVLTPGDMMVMFGSSLYMILCTQALVKDKRIWTEEFIIPGTCSVSAGTNAAGTLTRWYRDNIYFDKLELEQKGGENAYQAMLEKLDSIPPGSDGLITLPYFAGERTPINDPAAKGVLFGLKVSHTRDHMYKSALEAIGYTIAQHLDIFKQNDLKINKLMAVGGGTKNRQWMQIISDITGKTIRTSKVTIGASYGDAIMAALGAGHFKSFDEFENVIESGEVYVPDMNKHEKYKHYQMIYDKLYEATKDLMHIL